jgi:glutaminyl-tRNA synthetase
MSESTNFIHNIIEKDLENKIYGDKVYTRFPPEPNGYLHIGHAKSICLNFGTAKKYNGKCNLRFDDTNPVKEDVEYVDSIKADVKWLGFEWDELLFASDYFQKMYECAIELIKKGKAYICDLTADEIRTYRGSLTEPGKQSPYRDRSIEENLELFEKMKNGELNDGEKVLRAKIDMGSPNINMRDPVIYRISNVDHHNTGNEWCIYPMYDYAHPIEDAIEGITHSICTLEFEDHRPLYDWVLAELNWPEPPQQIEFARLNITNMLMSKRYLKALVDNGQVSGWDDPRMPTIVGLRRRGYTPSAIRDFCDRIGVSKANSTVDIALLEHCIREDLQTQVESKMVVLNPLKVTITNYPEGQNEEVEIENSKEDETKGNRMVKFSRNLFVEQEDFMLAPVKGYFRLFKGNEVRFKGAYFLTCQDYVLDDFGNVVELLCTYDPLTKSGSGFADRKVKGTIHWVDASSATKIKVRAYNYLMVENEKGETVFNENSIKEYEAYGEESLKEVNPEDRLQFFRHGYYIADAIDTNDSEKVFNQIVDLKSSWKK